MIINKIVILSISLLVIACGVTSNIKSDNNIDLYKNNNCKISELSGMYHYYGLKIGSSRGKGVGEYCGFLSCVIGSFKHGSEMEIMRITLVPTNKIDLEIFDRSGKIVYERSYPVICDANKAVIEFKSSGSTDGSYTEDQKVIVMENNKNQNLLVQRNIVIISRNLYFINKTTKFNERFLFEKINKE